MTFFPPGNRSKPGERHSYSPRHGRKGFSGEPGKLLNTITIPFTAEQEESQSTQLDESVAAFRAGISRVAAKIN